MFTSPYVRFKKIFGGKKMAMYQCPSVKIVISNSVPVEGQKMRCSRLEYFSNLGVKFDEVLTSTVVEVKTLDLNERVYAVRTKNTCYVVKVG